MKKLMAFFLAVLMLFSLSACGESDEDVKGSVQATEEKVFNPGTISGGVYENSYFGFGCELDDKWSFASPEELAEIMGQSVDMFDNEEYRQQMMEADIFYDMLAVAQEGEMSINIIVQKLEGLGSAVMSGDDFLRISEEDMQPRLESAGYTQVQTQLTEGEFLGESCKLVKVSCLARDIPYYTTQAAVKQGSRVAVITFASYYEDLSQQLMESFYPLG